jgi:hypothetical protein
MPQGLHDFLIGAAFVLILICPALAALNPMREKHRL